MTDDVLEVNGDEFDFSSVEEGVTLPVAAINSDWFAGPVTRQSGQIHVAILLPLGPDAPTNQRFPGKLQQDRNGLIDLSKVERVYK